MTLLEDIYNEIFKPEYLIKYGYFSYKKSKENDSDDDSYFKTETFYRMFNLNQLSQIAIYSLPSHFDMTITEPIYFNIPKRFD